MAKSKKLKTDIDSIVLDGKLTREEALRGLRVAAQRATEALPATLAQCQEDEEKRKVMADRDTVVLAYLTSLQKTLIHTGPLFEKMASGLEAEAESVKQKAAVLTSVSEAINLFADLVRLAASLALAFA